MSTQPPQFDPDREKRRRIVRRATLYTAGFFAAALLVAVLGAALVAWLLSITGLPFLETWIVISVLLLVVPLIGMAIGAVRRRMRKDGE